MIAGTKAKVLCRLCGFRFYPGHMPRHERACRKRQVVKVLKQGASA